MPEISVIIPTYNSEATINRALLSVFEQTFEDFEVIIIDDASIDKTLEAVGEFSRDGRLIILCHEENSGAAAARNSGLGVAKGRFVAFLDADDYWMPDKLRIQSEFMKRRCVHFTWTRSYVKQINGNLVSGRVIDNPVNFSRLLLENVVTTSSVMIDLSAGFEPRFPNLRHRQDYGLWLTLLRDHCQSAIQLPDCLLVYDNSIRGLSSNKLLMLYKNYKMFRKAMQYSRLKSGTFVAVNAIFRVFRYATSF